MTVVHEIRLIQVDPSANANKYYFCSLDSTGTLTKRWGRVGATGQTKIEHNATHADAEAAAYAKERRGYTRVEVIDAPTTNTTAALTNTAALTAAAKASLVTKPNKTLDALIERIAAANKHAITLASGGQITFNATGQATTALGVISPTSVARARTLLNDIEALPATDFRRARLVADYLTLVPQKVSAKRGWHETFATTPDAQAKQHDLLDALVAVVPAAQPAAPTSTAAPEVKFRYTVALADKATTKRIAAKFEADRNTVHSDTQGLRVKKVYLLTDNATGEVAERQKAVFQTRNVKTLWHGSRVANILNILRMGLAVAGTGTVKMESGSLFGTGVYASRESTKALRYSLGLWGAGGREKGSVFLFLADFAMGLEVRPKVASDHRLVGTKDPVTGKTYASVNVLPGTCNGARNHEAVVKDPARVRLNYLVELG